MKCTENKWDTPKSMIFFSFLLRHTMNRRKGGTYLKLTLQWLARDDRKLNQKKVVGTSQAKTNGKKKWLTVSRFIEFLLTSFWLLRTMRCSPARVTLPSLHPTSYPSLLPTYHLQPIFNVLEIFLNCCAMEPPWNWLKTQLFQSNSGRSRVVEFSLRI